MRLATATLIMVTLLCGGCIAIYTKRPVVIEMIDVSTQDPIADIPVTVEYSYVMILNAPNDVGGATDHDGKVILNLADFSNDLILMTLNIDHLPIPLSKEMVRHGAQFECRSIHHKIIVTLTPE